MTCRTVLSELFPLRSIRISNMLLYMETKTAAAARPRHPKTRAEIAADPRVSSIEKEYDGPNASWWCYLETGIITDEMECGTIHESTLAAVARVLRGARPAVKGEEYYGYEPEFEASAIAACAPFQTPNR